MFWTQRITKKGFRSALWVLVIVGSFVGSAQSVTASCGDHLSMIRHSPAEVAMKLDSVLSGLIRYPQQSAPPCDGPQCRGIPFKPLPVDLPIVGSSIRELILSANQWMLVPVAGIDIALTDVDFRIPIGFKQLLERPPAGY